MWGRLLLAAACLAGSAAMQAEIGVANAVRRDSDFRYVPDPDIIKVIAGAHRSTVADLFWLKTLPNLSREFKDTEFKERWLNGICAAVTDLDPGFLTIYVYGASWLPLIDKQSDSAVKLLQKGLRANTDIVEDGETTWWNPYRTRLLVELGMFYFKDRKDTDTALTYLRQAAVRPDCDGLTRLMVASLEVNEKRHLAALAPYLHSMQTGTDRMKERSEEALERLKAKIVRAAIREFEEREGRKPTSIDELRDPTLIEEAAMELTLDGITLDDEGELVHPRLRQLNELSMIDGAELLGAPVPPRQRAVSDQGRDPHERVRATPRARSGRVLRLGREHRHPDHRSVEVTPASGSGASGASREQHVQDGQTEPAQTADAQQKKILVTGGAGFIGSHLVKRLVELGHDVVVLDRLMRGNKLAREVLPEVELITGDVRDQELVRDLTQGCDLVYHFAAVLGVDVVADSPVETMETESIGMRNVAHAAVECGVDKLIYASTSGVYGHSAIEKSFTETIQLDPRTSYAIAKRFNEIYLAAMHDEKGLDSISIRFFNVYGPGQDNRMVIPRFFEQAFAGDPITVYGDGAQTRDFTHIDDSVTACVRLADLGPGCGVFNIANEHEETIGGLATLIRELTGSTSEIRNLEAPPRRYDFEVERRVGSSAKLERAIGFKPSVPLRDGLAGLVEHYRAGPPEG